MTQEFNIQIQGLKLSGLKLGVLAECSTHTALSTDLDVEDQAAHPSERILAIHGWQDNAASFIPLIQASLKYRPHLEVIALDLPGHGLSDWRSKDADYHFISWVRDVVRVLDALQWERCSLMGHSMGAAVATILAGAHPERIDHLYLIEGLGPLTSEAQESPQRLRRSHQTRSAPFRRFDDLESLMRRRQESTPMSDEAVKILMSRASELIDSAEGSMVQLRQDPRLRDPSSLRLTEAHVLEFISQIQCQTTLIQADQGFPFPKPLFENRISTLQSCTYSLVKGRHHVHMDDPEQVAECLWRR